MNRGDGRGQSIVAEALASAGNLHKENVEELMQKLRQSITDIRTEICQTVEQKYGQYLLNSIENARNLNSKLVGVVEEIDKTKRKIDAQINSNVDLTAEKLKRIEEELRATNESIAALNDVAKLNDAFEAIDESPDVLRRAELIVETEAKLNDIISANVDKTSSSKRTRSTGESGINFVIDKNALSALKNEFVTQKERISYELTEIWKEKIHCETDETENRVNIRLLNAADRETFVGALNSMLILSILDKKCVQLASFLHTSIFEPIVRREASLKIESVDGTTQITASKKYASRGDFSKNKTHVTSRNDDEILDDVHSVTDALIKLLDFKLVRTSNDQKIRQNFLQMIGERAAQPILRDVVVYLLKPAVPGGDRNETENFHKLLASCEMLENKMKRTNFLTDDFKDIQTFAADIDSLFLNKRCQTILNETRRLITSNLHNTVEVGVDYDDEQIAGDLLSTIDELTSITKEAVNLRELESRTPIRFDNEKRLPAMFRFPKCRVSETAFEFVKLLIQTLEEATASSQEAAGRLYETARYMLELFVAITPTYHKQALLSMPLLPAIFYNNCYYLSHHLMTLGFEYSPKLLTAMSLPSGAMQITFVDYVPKLRETAEKCMNMILGTQKQMLNDFLKSADGFSNLNDDERERACSKALKQCVMQLQLLNRIWKPVLTTTVLFKSQGILVGHLLSTLTTTILDMEDITADDAHHNRRLFVETLKQLEQLFLLDKATEIHRFCEGDYLKFKEICFMLSASLNDVDDRWASGQGPLAVWMKAEEVKSMLRALFQNTDKRAALMAKIK